MTSYSSMSARGREASVATTRGHRKVVAERIEYGAPEGGQSYPTCTAHLIGSCGHRLRWLAAVPIIDGEPRPSLYLTAKIGRRVTCQHDDCRIEPVKREPVVPPT